MPSRLIMHVTMCSASETVVCFRAHAIEATMVVSHSLPCIARGRTRGKGSQPQCRDGALWCDQDVCRGASGACAEDRRKRWPPRAVTPGAHI